MDLLAQIAQRDSRLCRGASAPQPGRGGDVRTPLSLLPDDLKALPRTRVEVKDEDGRTVVYEGVLVAEILKKAGAPLGGELRGGAMATRAAQMTLDPDAR